MKKIKICGYKPDKCSKCKVQQNCARYQAAEHETREEMLRLIDEERVAQKEKVHDLDLIEAALGADKSVDELAASSAILSSVAQRLYCRSERVGAEVKLDVRDAESLCAAIADVNIAVTLCLDLLGISYDRVSDAEEKLVKRRARIIREIGG